jgi:predicted metalloprotease with PDZ domain
MPLVNRTRRASSLVLVLTCLAAPAGAGFAPGAIDLVVDLADAPRRVFHARMTVPVTPGPLALLYPEWIPGEHSPSGPISDLVGLELAAGGRAVAWERDPLDLFTFRVEVPDGAETLEVRLDYLTPSAAGMFSASPATTDRLAVLAWNTVLLYPAGLPSDAILYRPSVVLPAGWRAGTALVEAGRSQEGAGSRIDYTPVSLTTLVDSPLLAGRHVATVALGEIDGAGHEIVLAADAPPALAMSEPARRAYRQLVAEARALFGARHYRGYRFLLTLSDAVESFGLEHHESSDNRVAERTLLDPELFREAAGLLPHEFVHSWNAKYRRPAGLATPDYRQPMVDDLLWVYEGLTSYLGDVLTARSGLWSPEEARERLAYLAAGMAERPGRRWRPLGDTARAAQILYGTRSEGASWRRGVDFYDEGVLVWLETDVRLRRAAPGRSLDDFCRRFFGGESGPPEVRPYTRADLVAALGEVAALDWESFFTERVDRVAPEAPLGGLEGGGWRLAYDRRPNAFQAAVEEAEDRLDLRFSLGLALVDDSGSPGHGRVRDVLPGSPAAQAGIAPGMTLLAVDGQRWSAERLRDAVERAGDGSGLELLLENADYYHAFRVDYAGGLRHPHLERIAGVPDLLSDILARRAPPVE